MKFKIGNLNWIDQLVIITPVTREAESGELIEPRSLSSGWEQSMKVFFILFPRELLNGICFHNLQKKVYCRISCLLTDSVASLKEINELMTFCKHVSSGMYLVVFLLLLVMLLIHIVVRNTIQTRYGWLRTQALGLHFVFPAKTLTSVYTQVLTYLDFLSCLYRLIQYSGTYCYLIQFKLLHKLIEGSG